MNPIVFALRRPFTVMVLVIAVALGSGLEVYRMPVDIFPNLNLPVISVAQPFGGTDLAQMEALLTNYYEYHFLYITGIHNVESKNIQGVALSAWKRTSSTAGSTSRSGSSTAWPDRRSPAPTPGFEVRTSSTVSVIKGNGLQRRGRGVAEHLPDDICQAAGHRAAHSQAELDGVRSLQTPNGALEDPLPDPDLAAVVAAWPELPEAIRAGIIAMVKAARSKGPALSLLALAATAAGGQRPFCAP
jgi:hypothetical protein